MRMNTLVIMKLMSTEMPPMNNRRERFSLGMLGAFDLSRMMKPTPPSENRNDDASPSMMY